jgi:hypothetical protein
VKCHCGSVLTHGDLSVLSFHATKVFTTFEGGAIVCPDAKTKQRIDYLKNFGFADEVTVSGTRHQRQDVRVQRGARAAAAGARRRVPSPPGARSSSSTAGASRACAGVELVGGQWLEGNNVLLLPAADHRPSTRSTATACSTACARRVWWCGATSTR